MFRVKENTEGKMKGMLINETPYVNHYFHQNSDSDMLMGVSYGPVDAGSFSGEFDSVGNGSSSSSLTLMTPFYDTLRHETVNPTVRYMDSGLVNKPNKECMLNVPYQLGLCENLQRMRIGDEHRNYCSTSEFRVDPDGVLVGFNDPLSNGVGGYNEDAFCGYSMGLRQGCDVNDSIGPFPFLSKRHSSALYSEDQVGCYMRLRKEQGSGYCSRNAQVQMPSGINDVDMPWLSDSFYKTQQCGVIDSGGLHSSQLFNPLLELDLGYKLPTVKQKARTIPKDGIKLHPPLSSMTSAEELGAFGCEDTFIVDGKFPKCVADKKSNRSKVHKKKLRHEIMKERSHEKELVSDGNSRHDQSKCKGVSENCSVQETSSAMLSQPLYCSLADLRGYIYLISKHQLGCRFLQRVFDEGNSEDVQIIFTEVIHYVVELMMDPFGNYLIQKLLDFCTEEQKLQIVLMVTKRRGELVSICMNTHGTRVVQKLIETLKSTQQISLVMIALKPGMVDLIKDMNGNHVVQRCLQCLSNEQNKFIFDAAAKFCVEIACHRHGCCVLNRCIAYSSGMHREKLVTSISANGLFLAQDAFGNYVIQHIIELKIPYAAATLLSLFEGHYAYLSMQKFSSHVVEKCLRCLEESRSRIIQELISVPHFDQLLQDRFANYVIQSALEVTKGSLHSTLVEALRPYEILRTSPYCKKIFSRNLLKK